MSLISLIKQAGGGATSEADLGGSQSSIGGLQHQKARLEVLQRLRRAAELSPEQTSQWEYFITTWDREMAEAHGEDWAGLFAQWVQEVLDDLGEGRSNSLSVYMRNEIKRVLGEALALLVLGTPRSS